MSKQMNIFLFHYNIGHFTWRSTYFLFYPAI